MPCETPFEREEKGDVLNSFEVEMPMMMVSVMSSMEKRVQRTASKILLQAYIT